MYLTTLRSIGSLVMCVVPKDILEQLGLSPNSRVGLSVTDGRIIVEPHPPRYTLAELLEKCDVSSPKSEEDQEWMDTPPTGREML